MLDEVLETGRPLEVERNGKTLVIAPKEEQSIWDRLPRREGFIVGDPDELIHVDWFHRLIAAHAIVADVRLVTANHTLLDNLSLATWG